MSDDTLLQVTQHDDVTVIHPASSINDRSMIIEFQDQLTTYVEQNRPKKLQVNFEYVKFFGSEGLSALIRAQRRVNDYDGQMNLCGMTDELRKVFQICKLDGTVFQIYDSCRDASAAFEDK